MHTFLEKCICGLLKSELIDLTSNIPNIAQLVELPTVDVSRDRAVPGSNPGVRTLFYFFARKHISFLREFNFLFFDFM